MPKKKKKKGSSKKINTEGIDETEFVEQNKEEKSVENTQDKEEVSDPVETLSIPKCQHLKVNVETIRILSVSGISFECQTCSSKLKKNKYKIKKKASKNKMESLWVCLSCSVIGCGRDSNEHAKEHAEKKNHWLVANLDSFQCWCYKCDEFIPIENTKSFKEINECLKMLKGEVNDTTLEDTQYSEKRNGKKNKENLSKKQELETIRPVIEGFNGIKGLVNIGNTCFFNSCIQNLTHIPILRNYLLDSKINNEGSLTVSLRSLMNSMWKESGSLLNPSVLFGEISKRAPLFRRRQQQDSHELLRYLLDGIDSEERKRIKLTSECAVTDITTFIQDIFGGQLRSTIMCSACGSKSEVFESFLDLSLPIPYSNKDGKLENFNFSSFISKKKQTKIKKQEPNNENQTESEEPITEIKFVDFRPRLENKIDSTLISCLHAFTDPESLEGEEMFSCEECTKRYLLKKGSLDLLGKRNEKNESKSEVKDPGLLFLRKN